MKKTSLASKLFTVLVTVLVSSLFTACGGGGGGGAPATPTTPVTPPTPAPTATVSSLFPGTGATGVAKTINPVVSLSVTDTTSGDASAVSWKCNNTTINFTSTAAPSPETKSLVVTFAPKDAADKANIHGGDYCTVVGDISVIGAGGTTKMPVSLGFYIVADPVTTTTTTPTTTTTTGPVTTTTVPTVKPAASHPIGEKVTGLNALPLTSTTVGDATWKQAESDGTIKRIDTGLIMTGFSLRPIVWNIFTRNLSNNTSVYCVTPTYKDDGSAIGNYTRPESACKTDAFDFEVGTNVGMVYHFSKSNKCYQIQWNESMKAFDDIPFDDLSAGTNFGCFK